MQIAVIYLFWFAWVAFLCATVRYSTQMFQQNSYRIERYNRWLRSTGEWHSRANMVALVGAVATYFTQHWALLLPMALWMLTIAIAEFSIEYKIKLAYTMRVKRLLVTRYLLVAGALVGAHYLDDRYAVPLLMAATFDYWIILANAINRPMEAAITRWYYNDAKRILRSMPHLTIIGITGSFGKTSTKHFLHRVLSERYNVLMTPGNFNTTLGVVRTIREHLKPHHEVFIVEMGAKQYDNTRSFGRDIAASNVDAVFVVNEVNREAITAGLNEGGYDMARVATVASFKEAMAELQPRLKAGDVVLYENDLPDSFK